MKNKSLPVLFLGMLLFNSSIAQTVLSREGVTIPTLEINLYAKAQNGTMYLADGILQNFNATYNPLVDNMDVRKFMNATDNLAIKNGNYNLVVERRPHLTLTDTIKLSLTNTRIAPYRFTIDPSVLFYPNINAYLKDAYLQTETPVSFKEITTVNFEITTDPLSKAASRFSLFFKKYEPIKFMFFNAVRNTNSTLTASFNIENENNIVGYSLEKSADNNHFAEIKNVPATSNNFTNVLYNLIDGNECKDICWYRVKATTVTGAIVLSDTVRLNKMYNSAVGLNIFPNPVQNGTINITCNQIEPGNYTIHLINYLGQKMKQESIKINETFYTKTIKLLNYKPGIYKLVLSNEKAFHKTASVLLQ